MSMVINSNIASLNAQRQLSQSQGELNLAMERLSSGKRINSAADDAAGLAITNRITSQVRGLNQAIRNANDGISMLQTAEGAMNETSNIMQRMRELAIQASNGTYSNSDRMTINAEYTQLVQELNRIGQDTDFNGRKLLDGSNSSIALQVGDQSGQFVIFDLETVNTFELGISSTSTELTGTAVNLDANGLLATQFNGNLSVNGTTLKTGEVGDTVATLVSALNQFDGISAIAEVDITGTAVGDGVLNAGQYLTLNTFDQNGEARNFSIAGGTTTLRELATAINIETEGYITASINNAGQLTLNSRDAATIAIGDPTNGSATGVENPGIYDEDISKVIEGLQTYNWIGEVETLISEYFGLTVDPADITLNIYNDSDDNRLAYVGSTISNLEGGNYTLNINMAYYTQVSLPDGTTESGQIPLERLIAHEMVHAVFPDQFDYLMAQYVDAGQDDGLKSFVPSWFTEGFPELLAGADERLVNDFSTSGSLLGSSVFTTAWSTVIGQATGSPTDPNASAEYSASYLGAKILTDGILASGNTLRDFFGDIETASATAISDFKTGATNQATFLSIMDSILSTAINDNTDWASLNDFETWVTSNGYAYLQDGFDNGGGGTISGSGVSLTVLSDFQDTDIGSIAGNDYADRLSTIDSFFDSVTDRDSLGADGLITANELLPNDTASDTGDFAIIYPDEYSGEFAIFNAQLRLNSDDKTSITITADTNNQATLADFGFLENNSLTVDEISEFVTTVDQAQEAIGKIDLALNTLSDSRSRLGAVMNRLDFTVNSLSNVVENTSAARSRILDADYAVEATRLTQQQVLQQAATAMLAQANARPQQVLSLLR